MHSITYREIEPNSVYWTLYLIHLGPIQLVAHPLSVILDSIVVSIPACHAGDRGSIPRRGDNIFHLEWLWKEASMSNQPFVVGFL